MRRGSQAGFTLFETMIASTVSMLVLMPAIAVMFRAFDWYAEVESALTLNQEARQAFDLLGNGARAVGAGNDSTPYLYGIRGRKQTPAGSQRTNYTLTYQSNNLTATGDAIASMTVTCTAAAQPLPDCPSAGPTRTVAGWIGNDVSIVNTARSVASKTVEVTVTVTHPFEALRLPNPADATQIYRSVFTLNRDEADP